MAEESEDFEGEDSTEAPLVTCGGGFWIRVILAVCKIIITMTGMMMTMFGSQFGHL